jgi:hypothetical protein
MPALNEQYANDKLNAEIVAELEALELVNGDFEPPAVPEPKGLAGLNHRAWRVFCAATWAGVSVCAWEIGQLILSLVF